MADCAVCGENIPAGIDQCPVCGASVSPPTAGVGASTEVVRPFAIGDIHVADGWITTPTGRAPLAGSEWTVRDVTFAQTRIPQWAIICAVAFAIFCLLGLFFLLAKETVMSGYVEVTVRQGQFFHVTQLPAANYGQVAYVHQLVAYAQSVSGAR